MRWCAEPQAEHKDKPDFTDVHGSSRACERIGYCFCSSQRDSGELLQNACVSVYSVAGSLNLECIMFGLTARPTIPLETGFPNLRSD